MPSKYRRVEIPDGTVIPGVELGAPIHDYPSRTSPFFDDLVDTAYANRDKWYSVKYKTGQSNAASMVMRQIGRRYCKVKTTRSRVYLMIPKETQ